MGEEDEGVRKQRRYGTLRGIQARGGEGLERKGLWNGQGKTEKGKGGRGEAMEVRMGYGRWEVGY